jgi:hypothetical protein
LPAIDRALGHILRHDDLRFGIDGGLGVVGLHEPVLALDNLDGLLDQRFRNSNHIKQPYRSLKDQM